MKARYFLSFLLLISSISLNYAKVEHINSSTLFTQTINKPLVVVKFSATWCGPCRASAPIFAQISEAFPSVIFVEVDVDKAKELADKYDIQGLPTFVYFKNGREVSRHSGAGESLKTTIKNKIESLLGGVQKKTEKEEAVTVQSTPEEKPEHKEKGLWESIKEGFTSFFDKITSLFSRK